MKAWRARNRGVASAICCLAISPTPSCLQGLRLGPAPSMLSSDFANLASEAEGMVLPRCRLAPW
jgi:hypothetical protein